MTYKTQFEPNASDNQIQIAKDAAAKLLVKFEPLFKKYRTLIKTGHINYGDAEAKRFVRTFIEDDSLKNALKKQYAASSSYHLINERFNFVVETFGKLPEEDIMIELYSLFFVLAKRYRPMGKNFCAYLYNSYGFEVSRCIKKFISNPANISYKAQKYKDYWGHNQNKDAPPELLLRQKVVEDCLEDKVYENSQGIPDMYWISGEGCSDVFQCLTPEERKLIVKYYLEDYNDRQIAELYGMYINTVNQKRRKAQYELAKALGINPKQIKRTRKSGKKALGLSQSQIA